MLLSLKTLCGLFIVATLSAVTSSAMAESAQTPPETTETGQATTATGQSSLATNLGNLESLDAATRLAAARALGELRDPAAVSALSRTLRSDPVPEVRAWCVQALNAIGTPDARSAITNAAQSDMSDRVRQLALSYCPECAASLSATPEAASPFDQSADASTAGQPAPADQQQPAAAPAEQSTPVPTAANSAPPPDPRRRARAIRNLATGVVLLVLSSVPWAVGGVLSANWLDCEWEGQTRACYHRSAYAGSMVLFSLAGAITLAGLVLTPIGAVRLAQMRETSQRSRWIGALTPYLAPSTDGGAVAGVSGFF